MKIIIHPKITRGCQQNRECNQSEFFVQPTRANADRVALVRPELLFEVEAIAVEQETA